MIQLDVLVHKVNCVLRDVNRNDFFRAAVHSIQAESTSMRERIEDALSVAECRNVLSVVLLVKEISGLLPVRNIDFDKNIILAYDDFLVAHFAFPASPERKPLFFARRSI